MSIEGDDASPVNAWINELHYDNDGTDEDEFVEIAVPSGFSDFANLQIVHYNGNGGGSIVSVDGTGLSQGRFRATSNSTPGSGTRRTPVSRTGRTASRSATSATSS